MMPPPPIKKKCLKTSHTRGSAQLRAIEEIAREQLLIELLLETTNMSYEQNKSLHRKKKNKYAPLVKCKQWLENIADNLPTRFKMFMFWFAAHAPSG